MDKGFYKNAKDTLKSMKDLDPETASREQFIMLGACLSILADEEHLGDSFPAMEAEHATEPHSAIVDSEQGDPSRIDMLLHDLTTAFVPYMKSKAEFMRSPTDNNADCMVHDLTEILDIQHRLFSALWRGVSHDSERQEIRDFFQRGAGGHKSGFGEPHK